MAVKKKVKTNPNCETLLGVDLSLNGTGIINLRGGKFAQHYAITDKLRTQLKDAQWAYLFDNNKITRFERLKLIRDSLLNIIQYVGPNYIAMEDYSLNSKHSTINTGEIGGIVRLAIIESGIPMRLYEPTKVKKFCTGSGSAPKSSMCVNVYKKWDVDFTEYKELGEDLADAFAIAKLLELELNLKKGNVSLKDQPQYIQEIFTGTSKAHPIPLIDSEFITK